MLNRRILRIKAFKAIYSFTENRSVSLKDLEAQTGMTFFVNLPADTASSIKAENPKNNTFWNLK